MCVYADSVLCVGQMKDSPGAIERWKGQVEGLRLYSSHQDAVRIQKDLAGKNIQPEEFRDRIIFM